jgi:hypothetical protein
LGLVGQEVPYVVTCGWKDWPKDEQPEDDPGQEVDEGAKVIYSSGCDKPVKFTKPKSQNNGEPNKFTGEEVEIEIVPFVIEPNHCPVKHECKKIKDPKGNLIDCNDDMFNDNFCLDPEDCPPANGNCPDGTKDCPGGPGGNPSVGMTCDEASYKAGTCIPGKYCMEILATAVTSSPMLTATD